MSYIRVVFVMSELISESTVPCTGVHALGGSLTCQLSALPGPWHCPVLYCLLAPRVPAFGEAPMQQTPAFGCWVPALHQELWESLAEGTACPRHHSIRLY